MVTALNVTEVEAFQQSLAEMTDFRLFPLLAETVLWAIFTVLFATSTYILGCRGLRSRSGKAMLALTLVMYILSTLDWAMDVRRIWTDLKIALPGQLQSPAVDLHKLDRINTLQKILQSIAHYVCTLVSDSVVCWRVAVVFGKDRRVIAIAVVFLVLLGSGVLFCDLTQIGAGFPEVSALAILAPHELPIDIATLILSALVNIWATGMIAWRAWTCRRAIRQYFKDRSRRSFTESILTLFVETGTIYTALWIAKNIIVLPVVSSTPYTGYATTVMYQVVGMYATVIIVLVTLQKSHLENQFTYGGNDVNGHARTTTTIRFASHMPSSHGTRWGSKGVDVASTQEIKFGSGSSGESSNESALFDDSSAGDSDITYAIAQPKGTIGMV